MKSRFVDFMDSKSGDTKGWERLDAESLNLSPNPARAPSVPSLAYYARNGAIHLIVMQNCHGWQAEVTTKITDKREALLPSWTVAAASKPGIDLFVGPYPRPTQAHSRIIDLCAKLGIHFPMYLRDDFFLDLEIEMEHNKKGNRNKGG